jgi:hypothetical protein
MCTRQKFFLTNHEGICSSQYGISFVLDICILKQVSSDQGKKLRQNFSLKKFRIILSFATKTSSSLEKNTLLVWHSPLPLRHTDPPPGPAAVGAPWRRSAVATCERCCPAPSWWAAARCERHACGARARTWS